MSHRIFPVKSSLFVFLTNTPKAHSSFVSTSFVWLDSFHRRGMYTESFTFRSSLSREGVACARARSFQNSQEKRNANTRNLKERVKLLEIPDNL